MKNKVFHVLLLVVLVMVVAGCGTKKEDSVDKNPSDNSDKKTEEKVTITSVLQGFEEGKEEALIKLSNSDNTYYVIDKNGKKKYTFEEENLSKTSNYIYRNNHLVLSYNDVNYVKDIKTGKTILNGDSKTKYVDITEDGYILVNVTEENLSGNKYYSRIIDQDGKVIWENENKFAKVEYFKVIINNIVLFSPNSYDKYRIINAKTGEETDLGLTGLSSYLDVSIKGNNILYGISANNDKYQIIDSTTGAVTKTGLSHIRQILNDKYVYATPLWETVGIYDYNGKLVKDLTEGEVNQITYVNNKYYVISKTGFYYTLNDSFDYIKEPKKIVGDSKKLKFTNFGIEVSTEDSKSLTYIPYEDFDPEKEFDGQSKKIDGLLEKNNSQYGFISNNSLTGYQLVSLPDFKEIPIEK